MRRLPLHGDDHGRARREPKGREVLAVEVQTSLDLPRGEPRHLPDAGSLVSAFPVRLVQRLRDPEFRRRTFEAPGSPEECYRGPPAAKG